MIGRQIVRYSDALVPDVRNSDVFSAVYPPEGASGERASEGLETRQADRVDFYSGAIEIVRMA